MSASPDLLLYRIVAVERLEPLLLQVVASGGDDLTEEMESTNEEHLPVSYPIGRACGLVYTWLKDDGQVVQEPRTGQDGGMRFEVLHASIADAGSYVCMLTHAPSDPTTFALTGGRRRPERLLSDPAIVVVGSDIGASTSMTEMAARSDCQPQPPELVHAPLMPLTPRRRREGKYDR